ncbi:MAG TPA: hypothetical protein VEO75_00265 [Nitrososphaerales archaeon]|nr:hypothetical protein [Nitrososphaerales archaeon]
MTTGQADVRRRYESLFFIGIAVVIVLLPFPNVFGILLDATVLAIAEPIIGDRLTLTLVFVYNFNPIKLNGVIGLYFVAYAVLFAVLSPLPSLDNPTIVSAIAVVSLLLLSLVEYLIIQEASPSLWDRLASRNPRFAALRKER